MMDYYYSFASSGNIFDYLIINERLEYFPFLEWLKQFPVLSILDLPKADQISIFMRFRDEQERIKCNE